MTILETIHLRMAGKEQEALVELIREAAGPEPSGTGVRIYRHSQFETDLVVHIHREAEEGQGRASAMGKHLASLLRSHGMVEHAVWSETGGQEGPSTP